MASPQHALHVRTLRCTELYGVYAAQFDRIENGDPGDPAQPEVESDAYTGAGDGLGCDERGSLPDYKLARQRTLQFFTRHPG